MGKKYHTWISLAEEPLKVHQNIKSVIEKNRNFLAIDGLDYGDFGIYAASKIIAQALANGKRIGLYADYDVDGTMSCVSWIWFLRAIGYQNFIHYIPCRFKEGYGLNLAAIQYLIDEQHVDLIITMDTGITANAEAVYCREHGVQFICTDHHKIQPEKMPDCVIVNPKQHEDERYRDLCGCGITFVLLRALARLIGEVPAALWGDLMAITGIATICDVVPLHSVNHRLARLGIMALCRSQRPVLKELMRAASDDAAVDEGDIGFRLGPRINAVGRLEHADLVVKAFVDEDPAPLVAKMGEINNRRKILQETMVRQALERVVASSDDHIVFMGAENWHAGVVGIVASKVVEHCWKPTFLYQIDNGLCKGSARSIEGFDVTQAMMAECSQLFIKFGGHAAAGGFSFNIEQEPAIKAALNAYGRRLREHSPAIWQSKIKYDCEIDSSLLGMELAEVLNGLKPFGHGFESPLFMLQPQVEAVRYYKDKHTAVLLRGGEKIMFFNELHKDIPCGQKTRFLIAPQKSMFGGRPQLSLMGRDYDVVMS